MAKVKVRKVFTFDLVIRPIERIGDGSVIMDGSHTRLARVFWRRIRL